MATNSSSSSSTAATAASGSAAPQLPALTPVPLEFGKAANPLWLVKIPKYLAKKWSEAPDTSQVGKLIITQSKGGHNAPKVKPNIVFQLNEQLGQNVQMKVGENKFIEHKIPLEHKFLMTPIANQNVYILKQGEEGGGRGDALSIMGKVIQRAECTPAQNDSSYMSLKRETNKQFNEPKNFIKIVDDRASRSKFIPKIIQYDRSKDKGQPKRLRADRDKVQDALFSAFTKHQYYTMRDLEKITRQPHSYLKDILHEICRHNTKGPHKNTWELKEEYRQTNSAVDAKGGAAGGKGASGASGGASGGADVDNMDDDDDDDDDDDFEDLDDDDDDAMIGQM